MKPILTLLLVTTLLLGCTSTRPSDYSKQSDQAVIQALHNSASQPHVDWSPLSPNTITDSMLSVGGNGYSYSQASHDNAYHIAGKRIESDPKPYFVMLTSNDPNVVLTALCLFHASALSNRHSGKLDTPDTDLTAQVIRDSCLKHQDPRIRYYAALTLIKSNHIEFPDIALLLADDELVIREASGAAIRSLKHKWAPQTGPRDEVFTKCLQGLMIHYLDDDRWSIRYFAADFLAQTTPPAARKALPPITGHGINNSFYLADKPTAQKIKTAWAAWWAAN